MIDKSKIDKIGRVIGLHGQRAELLAGDEIVEAVVRGKVKFEDAGKSAIAVGDFVMYSEDTKDRYAIEKILPRGKIISKPSTENEQQLQVFVANVDCLVIVSSVADPDFKPGLVDRFLVTAFKENIRPIIVLNKIDLKSPDYLNPYFDVWKKLSCEIVYTSAKNGDGISLLKSKMENGTAAIAGHSGVGKSTLINVMCPGLELRTKEISAYSNRGVHTTTGIRLYKIFPNGWIADTPGIKVYGLAGVNRKNLKMFFPEFTNTDTDLECQFSNCAHINEPSCAVKKIIDDPESPIARFRYESYVRIYESLKI